MLDYDDRFYISGTRIEWTCKYILKYCRAADGPFIFDDDSFMDGAYDVTAHAKKIKLYIEKLTFIRTIEMKDEQDGCASYTTLLINCNTVEQASKLLIAIKEAYSECLSPKKSVTDMRHLLSINHPLFSTNDRKDFKDVTNIIDSYIGNLEFIFHDLENTLSDSSHQMKLWNPCRIL